MNDYYYKMSNTITDGLCRCCHTEGDFKNLGIPYNNNGIDEVFCDMIGATFCIDVTTLEGEVDSSLYGICDVCQLRLKDATSFKQQVLKCEQKFQQFYIDNILKGVKKEVTYDENETTYDEKEIKYEDEEMPVMDIEDQPLSMLRSNQRETEVSDKDADWTAAGDHSDDETTKPMKLKTKKFSCDVCQKSFSNNGSLEVHMRIHTGEKTYQCHLCNNKFVHNKALTKPIENNHSDGDRYPCTICTKTFKKETYLNAHNRLGRCEKKELKFICNHCEKEFHLKFESKRHLIPHTGEKKYICKVCNKPFGRNQTLKNHMLTHTGEKNYICEVCNKRFGRNHTLKSHMLTHAGADTTGIKLYSCSFCSRQFTGTSILKRHERTHTGERPFSCKVCEKPFFRNCHLKRHMLMHMRVHSDKKPFMCNILLCNKRFTKIDKLKDHMRVHTGEEPY